MVSLRRSPFVAVACGTLIAVIGWLSGWYGYALSEQDGLFNTEALLLPAEDRPVLTGSVEQEGRSVEMTLLPGPIQWSAKIDEQTREFETQLPAGVPPGTYALYIDDVFARSLIVQPVRNAE